MLSIQHLNKAYKSFSLKDVSFEVKPGTIMGFIGRNGAGKTTTIKSIVGLTNYDSGTIKLFGKEMSEDEFNIKQNIGFTLCDINYYADKTIKQLTNVTSRFYGNWDQIKFDKLCNHFNLDQNKKLNELSRGMSVKYTLAVALSHDAKLLILDEPTSGLDPISRDEILQLFWDFIKDNRSILFSTHITSDLDKCANQITYIHDGLIIYTGDKINFINQYLYVNGNQPLTNEQKTMVIGYINHNNTYEGIILANDKQHFANTKTPSIEQIMVCLERNGHEEFTL